MLAQQYAQKPVLAQFPRAGVHGRWQLAERLWDTNHTKRCANANDFDEVPADSLRYSFAEVFTHLESTKVLDSYGYQAADKASIISTDGVEHFSSTKVHCSCCTVKKYQDGNTSYHHAALVAVIVYPDKA